LSDDSVGERRDLCTEESLPLQWQQLSPSCSLRAVGTPSGRSTSMAEACQSVAPRSLAVGSLSKPEADVIYCVRPDDMHAMTSGDLGAEDVAAAVVKLAANGKWYVASS